MSDLMASLRRHIEVTGPVPLNDFMAQCLCHPRHGYYMKQDPFGAKGDFTTAPEISQMFGELLGLWAAIVWQQMGMPSKLHLVELGPGRGTLMSDALRATRSVPGFHAALDVHLVEISPVLKASQKEILKDVTPDIFWHENFSDIPEGPAIYLANEFFDALPIRQFEKGEKGWAERFVDIDPVSDGLRFVLQPDEAATAFLSGDMAARVEGGLFEVSPVAQTIAHALGERLAKQGGAVLVLDYGYARSGFGDTLQALQEHKYVNVLTCPGDTDLTAHVNFEKLAQGFREGGAEVFGPLSQGDFLERLGIAQRAQILLQGARADQRESLMAAHRRLVHPEEMGTLFKVLCAIQPGQAVPPAFEEVST